MKYIDDELAQELQQIAGRHGFEIVPDSPPPDLKNKLKKALSRSWAKIGRDEKVLAVRWTGSLKNGSKGTLITNAGVYGYYGMGYDEVRVPFEGLCTVTGEGDYYKYYHIHCNYLDNKNIINFRFAYLNNTAEAVEIILSHIAHSNAALKTQMEAERETRFRSINDWHFREYVYRYKDMEFVVPGKSYYYRDIHSGKQGWFVANGENDTDYGIRTLVFNSYTPRSWMQRHPSGIYYSRETVHGRVFFEIAGKIEMARYNGGNTIGENPVCRFSSDPGTKEELKLLKPGDNVFYYIDADKIAHIVYSVHTKLCWRDRTRPITFGDVDPKVYIRAFDGYDTEAYELSGDPGEEKMRYLI